MEKTARWAWKTALSIVGSAVYAIVAVVAIWWLYARLIRLIAPIAHTSGLFTLTLGLLFLVLAIPPWQAHKHQISWILIALAELAAILWGLSLSFPWLLSF